MQEFSLENSEFIELKKLLKASGLCENGGHAKAVIEQEEVMLDGEIETRKSKKVFAGQVVSYNGETIKVIA